MAGRQSSTTTLFVLVCALHCLPMQANEVQSEWPRNVRVVLENTQPLRYHRGGRLPLYVLPISHSLSGLADDEAEQILRELDRRGIGYTVDWNHQRFDESLAEGLRIARWQTSLGQPVAVNATACLYSFFDGSEDTLHIDDSGQRFADTSSGRQLGCPFALQHRIPVIQKRIDRFLRGYRDAGLEIDFIFADWEIDGPIEWNDGWAACRRCARCRDNIARIDDFRAFQQQLREIRSAIQRVAFGDAVTSYFPTALVGNYGTYPHGGVRYWYDYFEQEVKDQRAIADQRANYREWSHEFEETGYTFAMPVVYTWYPTFGWYDFENLDYRWFYNMLLVASNAGKHTPQTTPIIPFVHWTTTSPPPEPDPRVRQFNPTAYQELLWHLLLRGHDTFFLWCISDELPDEIKLVHEVYADSLHYKGFLERGTPINFHVPPEPADIVSGLRIGNRVLVRRTFMGPETSGPLPLALAAGEQITIPAQPGLQVVPVETQPTPDGFIKKDGRPLFPIGFYDLPADLDRLHEMADAGVNLVRCDGRADLDRAWEAGIQGWLPLAVQQGATDALKQQINAVVDHPALAVWEGPDEIVWTFTAYSFLEERAGFTRDDWNRQSPIAVDYAKKEAAKIMPRIRAGIELVRQLDERNLPFWINEAADSDVYYARQYMPYIDITGCDYYAVRSTGTDLQSSGRLVDRWHAIGRGKPVWMVLQAFSWHTAKPERTRLYPTFFQSRFMAYDAIVHGAKGILYWGARQIEEPQFRESLYALTSELAAVGPLLTGQTVDNVGATVIPDLFEPPGKGVRARLLRNGDDYLLLLVNEDDHRHLAVDVTGLSALNGRKMYLLYGDETVGVSDGNFVTRMQPYDVKVFCSSPRRFQSDRLRGRQYP